MQLVDVPVCCNGLDLCANTLTVKGAKACADATEPKPADQYNIFIVRTYDMCFFSSRNMYYVVHSLQSPLYPPPVTRARGVRVCLFDLPSLLVYY